MKNAIAIMVALALLPATTFAGGGDKATSHIKVTNGSAGLVAVIVDSKLTAAQLAALTKDQFTAKGGFFLNGKEAKTVNAKAGNHTVQAAYVNTATGKIAAGGVGAATVSLGENKTVGVTVTGNAATKAKIE